MSKIIMIVVAVVVVAGGGYYYFNSSKNGDAMVAKPVVQNNAAPVAAVPSGKKIPFSDFIKQGGAYKCTVHQDVGGTATEGVTYISGGMIRGEYNTKVQGLSVNSTMIVRDGYTYSWTSMAPGMGFKTKIAQNAPSNPGTASSGSYNFNAEQIGDYNCEPWTVDASKFAVPTGVTFKEVGAK
jgi:hypothetical protein